MVELIQRGRLWSRELHGEPRIPVWQFTASGLLPGLSEVVAAIPDDCSPSALAAYMGGPDADYGGRTPSQWLIDGGDPTPVAAWVPMLDLW